MLRFFYSGGSSALAAHILLEEVGASYEPIEVSIPKGEHLAPGFLRCNPKGRIPVLETPDGIISENPAILEYIATTHPDAGTLPDGPFEQARARSLAAYLCATVHVAFAHKRRGQRWADHAASLKDLQNKAPQNLRDCASLLEQEYAFGPWVLGPTYSFCDPYLFLMGHWLSTAGISIEDYPRLAAHRGAMRARPATERVLQIHGLI